jgi:mxaJ protein
MMISAKAGVAFSVACLLAWPPQALGQSAGLGAAGELVDPNTLRVCADPSNLPMSDKNGKGFENKLADLVAKKLGRKSVEYTWYPQVQGFVRNTLSANLCDVIMGYPQGDELVQNTNAYYKSSYVLIYKRDGLFAGVETIEDAKLADKRIGIVEGTPPSRNMAAAKLMRNARIYPLMVDTRFAPSVAEVMIKDLVDAKIDLAILWGPTAGYYAKASGAALTIVPLLTEKAGSRMSYRITMGVRPSDQEWKRTLNAIIKDNQKEFNRILLEYGVPLVDEHDQLITQ